MRLGGRRPSKFGKSLSALESFLAALGLVIASWAYSSRIRVVDLVSLKSRLAQSINKTRRVFRIYMGTYSGKTFQRKLGIYS
jgi:hypothetical protein